MKEQVKYIFKELIDNAKRFKSSGEFQEVLKIKNNLNPNAKIIMDMSRGNGIATYAFTYDYIFSVRKSGLSITNIIKYYNLIVYWFLYSSEELNIKILNSSLGKILFLFIFKIYIISVRLWYLNSKKGLIK
jgi:hypothetical protein